ncbi:hypothetical protein E5F05_01815 (plasmid) [Deinococcus metallilatus]|nr:hypothetical protein E5F05_01815 [Deinococcus metallilatus]
MTAMGTDADYYASANEMATMNASSMENVSAGPQLGGDVKDNVRAAYAQRGLSWTPDSDITASEVNSAVEANLAAREMGSTPSVVTGDVSVADPEQAAESAGARGYAFVPDEAVSELAESRTVQRRAEQAMAASSGEPVKVSYVPSAAVRTAAVRAGAVVVGGGGPEDLLADAIAVGTFFYSLYQYNKNAAYLASNGSGDSSNQRATNVQTGAAAGAPNPNGDKNKGSTQPTKKGSVKDAQLPTEGRIRYVPPQDWDPSNPLPRAKVGGRTGYVDRFGNVWIKGPSRTPGEAFEWDVQLSRQGKSQLGWASRDGSHLNVSLRGRITH